MKEKVNVSKIVREVFDNMPVGTDFSGIEFKRLCVKSSSKVRDKYEDTFLRLLRMHRRTQFVCIDRFRSKYRKIA